MAKNKKRAKNKSKGGFFDRLRNGTALNSRSASFVYVVYYTLMGILLSLTFSVLRPSLFDSVLAGVLSSVAITAAVNALPLFIMAKTKASVASYIAAPLCTLPVVVLALLQIFVLGLIFFGVLLGLLLFFLNGGRREAPLLLTAAACVIIAAGFCVFSAYNYVEINGMHYKLEEGGYALLEARNNPDLQNEAVVESEINNRPVKRVDKNAFVKYGAEIAAVNIPKSISVPYGTLAPCVNLQLVYLDFSQYNIYWFFGNEMPADALEAIEYIPRGLKYVLTNNNAVGAQAFMFSDIERVILDPSTEVIGAEAFFQCSSLTEIDIGKNVIHIGDSAFKQCFRLSTIGSRTGVVELGFALKTIGAEAFANCYVLGVPTLPETLVAINAFAFSYCNAFPEIAYYTPIRIPASVAYMGPGVFYGSLSTYNASLRIKVKLPYAEGHLPLDWDGEWNIIIDEGFVCEIEYEPSID